MMELTPAELELIKSHREKNCRKYETWAKEMREHGYIVESPTMAVLPVVKPETLARSQRTMLAALSASRGGLTMTQTLNAAIESGAESMPRGTAGRAMDALVQRGYARREGLRYWPM